MTPNPLALLMSDVRLSADARVLGYHIATRADGGEIERDDFRRLLGGAGKERVYNALGELELWKYIERKRGGRGHSDSYRFTGGEIPPLSDSGSKTPPLNADSGGKTPPLNGPSSPSSPPPSPERAGAREPTVPADDLDLARLRKLLSGSEAVLEYFRASAAHPATWPRDVWSQYRPPDGSPNDAGGPEWVAVFARYDEETAVRVLVSAFTDYAGLHEPFAARRFRGFVRSALREIERAAAADLAAASGAPPARASPRAERPPADSQVYNRKPYRGLNR